MVVILVINNIMKLNKLFNYKVEPRYKEVGYIKKKLS